MALADPDIGERSQLPDGQNEAFKIDISFERFDFIRCSLLCCCVTSLERHSLIHKTESYNHCMPLAFEILMGMRDW